MQCADGSGETVITENIDISSVDDGDCLLNYNHLQAEDTTKKGSSTAPGQEIVGIVLSSHKVLRESDAQTTFEKKQWKKLQCPFLQVLCQLYDGAGHPGAQAIAAAMRDDQANGRKVIFRLSIEGSTLERNGQELTRTVMRKLAVTEKPANKACDVEILQDPGAPIGYDKEPGKDKNTKDLLEELLEAKKTEHPLYRSLSSYEGEVEIIEEPVIKKELKLLVLANMRKALSAGSYGGAPGTLTGGSALQVEHLDSIKNRAKAALRDFDSNKRHFNKKEFREFAKAKLPEVDDSFLDHFSDLAEDLHLKLKKSTPISTLINRFQELTIDLRKAAHDIQDDRHQRSVLFAGHRVVPGLAKTNDQEYSLLHEDPTGYKAVPKDKERSWETSDLVHLPREQEAKSYIVVSRPTVLVSDLLQ